MCCGGRSVSGPPAQERAVHELEELEFTPFDETGAAGVERPDRRSANRRAHTRYQLTTTAEYVDVESGARGSARSSDISLGGCFLDTTTPHPVGTQLKLRLSKEGRSFESLAKVVCAMPGMGMGLRFLDPAPQARQVVEDWIAELTGVPCTAVPAATASPAAPEPLQAQPSKVLSNDIDTRFLLMELIVLLTRKGVLDVAEGDHLLRRIN